MFAIVEKLELLCEQRRPVTVTAGRPGRILKGRFRFCSNASGFVGVELFDLPSDIEIQPASPCTVVFAEGARSALFISEVISLDTSSQRLPVLRVRIPHQAARAEARSNLRIPLDEVTAPRVTVRTAHGLWRPRALDISIAGMLVELPAGESFPTAGLEELEIELTRNGINTVVEGFAQPRWGTFWALYFSDVLRSLRHGDADVPSGLRQLLVSIENDWLRSN